MLNQSSSLAAALGMIKCVKNHYFELGHTLCYISLTYMIDKGASVLRKNCDLTENNKKTDKERKTECQKSQTEREGERDRKGGPSRGILTEGEGSVQLTSSLK